MPENKKTPRTEALRKALDNKPKVVQPSAPPLHPKAKVAAAATPTLPKKQNPRSAAARDARSKERGRVPLYTTWSLEWMGDRVEGQMQLWDATGELVTSFSHKAEGVFRLLEELDIRFWNWFVKDATDDQKKRLGFAPNPPVPAPFVDPSAAAGTDAASP